MQVFSFKQPLTPWAKQKDLKQAGGLFSLTADSAYHAYGMSLLTRVLGWSSEDAQKECDAARDAHYVKKSGIHAYSYLWVNLWSFSPVVLLNIDMKFHRVWKKAVRSFRVNIEIALSVDVGVVEPTTR